jgi:uncharacterized LabA/DUF88 family protein
MKKAILFFDANNFYHNVKRLFTPSDIEIIKLADFISKDKNLDVLEIRWYTSVPDIELNKIVYMNHMNFLSSLRKKGVKVITRKLQKLSTKEIKKKRKQFIEDWELCEVCKPLIEASFLDMSDNFQKEKGIDVWIAIDMVKEAINENIDTAVLISGDADFVPAFNLITDIGKEVLSCSVPNGYSNELRQKFPFLILTRTVLNKCLRNKDK